MSKSKQKTLELLVDLTQDQTNKAGQELHKLVAERNGAQQQLEVLQSYRQDYATRLGNTGKNGITASNYHNFTRFLGTLDEAILQQTKVMEHLDYNIDVSKNNWRASQRRLHSYEALQTRHKQQEIAAENRRDQIITDEISAAFSRRRQFNRGI